MAKSLLKGAPRKKKRATRRVSQKNYEPDISKASELDGPAYGRLKDHAYNFYRMEFKGADYKRWILEYCKDKPEWKKHIKAIGKNPEWRFSCTLGTSCRLMNKGLPSLHKPYADHWRELPGTMGEIKPMEDFIDKQLKELIIEGSKVIEEVKKKEAAEQKLEARRPSIQERIASQSLLMMGAVDDWLDTWGSNPGKFDPKSFRISKHLNDVKCTQAHARKIKEWYTDEIAEFTEVLQPPSKAQRDTMSERDRDYAEQLIEAYADFEKKDVKKYLEALTLFMGACDIIIDTAKANRKPRKRIRSKEKMVSKLRFRVNDEKFQLASINPQEIIGAEELWVFNIKTRKLGRYVASSKDPLHQRREGTGLSVKGTTITGFSEDESIQKTLRKPEEKLKEFKDAGKIKIKKFLDEINAVDIKLNGRINPETILLKTID